MNRSYCDNCNAECRPYTVTVDWSPWEDGITERQRKIHGLCESCARMIATLDFAGLAEAHAGRRRTVNLP